MASFRKKGRVWYYRYTDADGVKREKKGCPDRRATEAMAAHAEAEAARIRAGLIDARDLARARHSTAPLGDHLRDFEAHLSEKGDSPSHARLYASRARRLAALACGANLAEIDPPRFAGRAEREGAAAALSRTLAAGRLVDLTISRVQGGLATLRASGRSLQTLNHHRAALRSFVLWARGDGRLRDDPLVGLASFNAKEDRRHDRRTLSLDEMRSLVESALTGPLFREMTGPARALCYRLAVASGLRYSEIKSIRPESIHFSPSPSVTILAGFAKNGETATLPLPVDLARDLAPFVAAIPHGGPVFRLPTPERRRHHAPRRPGPRRHPVPRCLGASLRLPRPAMHAGNAGRRRRSLAPGRPTHDAALQVGDDGPLHSPPGF